MTVTVTVAEISKVLETNNFFYKLLKIKKKYRNLEIIGDNIIQDSAF